jgi:hypothetical protein
MPIFGKDHAPPKMLERQTLRYEAIGAQAAQCFREIRLSLSPIMF